MNNYRIVDLLIAIPGILLLIVFFLKIKTLLRVRNNNLNKVDKELNDVLNEITEEINILNEDTEEDFIKEITDINDYDVNSYFEITNSIVIMHSNFII